MTPARFGPALLGVLLAGGCTVLRPLDDLREMSRDGGSDGGGPRSIPLDQPCTRNEDCATGLCTGTCQCPEGMVRVPEPGFCIDATEVTNRAYTRFVEQGPLRDLRSLQDQVVCGWNTSVVPRSWPPSRDMVDLPVVNVDWCDAHAYCRWLGKRLCGGVAGPLAPGDFRDPTRSQWSAACGRSIYPYGNIYEESRCNGADFVRGQQRLRMVPIRNCEGGVAGLFDMSGSAFEWEDACASGTEAAPCHLRGGSFRSAGPSLTCEGNETARRDLQRDDVGFRCCTP
jgi:formylglycine-generating enzyme